MSENKRIFENVGIVSCWVVNRYPEHLECIIHHVKDPIEKALTTHYFTVNDDVLKRTRTVMMNTIATTFRFSGENGVKCTLETDEENERHFMCEPYHDLEEFMEEFGGLEK